MKLSKLFVRCLPILFICCASHVNAQSFVWAQPIGNSTSNTGNGIAVDANGNSYIFGMFYGDIAIGQIGMTSKGGADMFIAKYDAAGNLLWANRAGGRLDDYATGIAVDAMGNCYVTGYFADSASFGSFTVNTYGSYDAFLAKYDANGMCKWAAKAGGQSDDWGEAVAVNANGDIFVTGNFQQTAQFGNWQLTTNGDRDVFIARYDSLGTCVWAQHGGGSWIDEGRGISTDKLGNCYVTGCFSPPTAQFGTFTLTSQADREIFIAKYDGNGTCMWANQANGAATNFGNAISTDASGNSTITGFYLAPTMFDQFKLPSFGVHNAFVARYDKNGACAWAVNAGGTSFAVGKGVSVDALGNSFVTGAYGGTVDFGNQQVQQSIFGGNDGFLVKYDRSGTCMWAKSAGGAGTDNFNAIAINNKGSLWMTGLSSAPPAFGPFQLSASGAFVTKFNDGITSVERPIVGVPIASELMQNYPNPFNPSTTISFAVSEAGPVAIKVYDASGKEAAVVLDKQLAQGYYSIVFDASRLPSGVYFCRLTAAYERSVVTDIKRMMLLK
jgi:hypothetical protein